MIVKLDVMYKTLRDTIDKPIMDADGKGTISLTISNPLRSNGGNYKCTIVGRGKPYTHENRLCVHWIKMLDIDKEAEEGDTFEMNCKYGPVDACISGGIWNKLYEDGTSTSISKESQFVTSDCKGLRISKVTSADAGKYQCIVKLHCGRQVMASRKLVVNKGPVVQCLNKKKDAIKAIDTVKVLASEGIGTTGEVKNYEADFDEKRASLRINPVTAPDACEVVSQKNLTSNTRHTSATLMPLNVFGSSQGYNRYAYRHPAVVLANKKFLVFCEQQVDDNKTRGLIRRGKLMEHNRIVWKPQQTILDKTDTRFQNLVPIVVDDQNGGIILLCVECTAQQDGCKIIQMKSLNGINWSDPTDVHLKWPEDMQEYPQLHCIGPGHGLCLKSGKLAVAGFIKFSEQVQLCVIISDNRGATWEVVPVPSSFNPNAASFGNHAQIVEYAKDQICITCSLKDCQQRFNVFSSDGCKTFHKAKLEPTLIEANPGCQAGIISIPSKMKKGLVAFINPADESNFKKLSIRLSKDGCETWTDPCPPLIGRQFAASSDLAYCEEKDNRGLLCVYENINITEGKEEKGYCILMQLISLDEIEKKSN